MTLRNGSLFLAAALALGLPSGAHGDERVRVVDPAGLRAREEVAVSPAPAAPAPVAVAATARQRAAPAPAAPAPVAVAATARQRAAPAPVAATARQRAAPAPITALPRRHAEAAAATTTTRTARAVAPPRRPRRAPPPCFSEPIELVRVEGQTREVRRVSLTFCDGRPVPAALDALSVLARPHGVEAPSERALRAYARRLARRPRRGETPADPAYVVDGVLRLEAGLLPRVARIAGRFTGKPLELVSGWRPSERVSSRHHHGRALDLRVRGVSREVLRDFARSLDETGVGYYPNSVFVHVDVRERRAYWVDRSGPGEEADYGSWPPPAEEQLRTRDRIVADAIAALDSLRVDVPSPDAPATPEQAEPESAPPEPATEEGASRALEPAVDGEAVNGEA